MEDFNNFVIFTPWYWVCVFAKAIKSSEGVLFDQEVAKYYIGVATFFNLYAQASPY